MRERVLEIPRDRWRQQRPLLGEAEAWARLLGKEEVIETFDGKVKESMRRGIKPTHRRKGKDTDANPFHQLPPFASLLFSSAATRDEQTRGAIAPVPAFSARSGSRGECPRKARARVGRGSIGAASHLVLFGGIDLFFFASLQQPPPEARL